MLAFLLKKVVDRDFVLLSNAVCVVCVWDQPGATFSDVMPSFWSQMRLSLQLHFSTCLAQIHPNQSDNQHFAVV